MPSADLSRTSQRRPTKPTKPAFSILKPSSLPCALITEEINKRVRSNPALLCPNFDFATFANHRSYMVGRIQCDTECAALLDSGVHSLLQKCLEVPAIPPAKRFVVRETTDAKGLGMFAQNDIPAGHVILVEHPTIILPYLLALSTPLEELHVELLKCLSPSTYAEVMTLSRGASPTDNHLEDILNTNALAVDLYVPDNPNSELPLHRALFLKASMCNHSCGPNARWDWDPSTLALTVTAVRPIRKNEEITITYIAPDQPREARLKALEFIHGFRCRCKHCSAPDLDGVLHSDLAREVLHRAWLDVPTFVEWCQDPSMPDDHLISFHLGTLFLIEQESLQVLDYGPGLHLDLDVGRHVDGIAMCYGALEDQDNFLHWIGRVKAMHTVWHPERAAVFKKWITDPFLFPLWGYRKASKTLELSKLGKCDSVLDLV